MTYTYAIKDTEQQGDILLLTLAPKSPAPGMEFVAGQYASIGFLRGRRPSPMRCFSIVSAPGSGVLQFAMRVRGRFTRTAAALQPGDLVRVQGPFGEFTVDEAYDERLVLIAGGIGITPFLSIMRDATERQLQIPITLLFANRSAQSIPFYRQLRELQQRNPLLRIRFFCSEITDTMPDVVQGSIDDGIIAQLTTKPFAGSTYFICGPKGLAKNIRKGLLENHVHESRILTESFTQMSAIKIGDRFSVRALTYGFAAASMAAGIAFFTLLDLNQTLPKLARAQTKTVQTTTPTTSATSNTTTGTTTQNTTNNSSTTTTTPTQNYQQPVSSVS